MPGDSFLHMYLSISPVYTIANTSCIQGQVEVSNRIIKHLIKTLAVCDKSGRWHCYLNGRMEKHNNFPKRDTRVIPYEIHFGRRYVYSNDTT